MEKKTYILKILVVHKLCGSKTSCAHSPGQLRSARCTSLCAGGVDSAIGRFAHKACAQGLEHKPAHNHRTLCAQLRTTPCAQGLGPRPRITPGCPSAQGNAHKADPCAQNIFYTIQYIIAFRPSRPSCSSRSSFF